MPAQIKNTSDLKREAKSGSFSINVDSTSFDDFNMEKDYDLLNNLLTSRYFEEATHLKEILDAFEVSDSESDDSEEVEKHKKQVIRKEKLIEMINISSEKCTALFVKSVKNDDNIMVEKMIELGYEPELEDILQVSGFRTANSLRDSDICQGEISDFLDEIFSQNGWGIDMNESEKSEIIKAIINGKESFLNERKYSKDQREFFLHKSFEYDSAVGIRKFKPDPDFTESQTRARFRIMKLKSLLDSQNDHKLTHDEQEFLKNDVEWVLQNVKSTDKLTWLAQESTNKFAEFPELVYDACGTKSKILETLKSTMDFKGFTPKTKTQADCLMNLYKSDFKTDKSCKDMLERLISEIENTDSKKLSKFQKAYLPIYKEHLASVSS